MPSNTTKTVYKISDFLSWQKAKTLVLSPSFQRRSVWPAAAKSYFIDTIARGYPIPIIFLREQTDLDSLEPLREVVDGQQRLRTIISYINPDILTDYDEGRDAFEIKRIHNPEAGGENLQQAACRCPPSHSQVRNQRSRIPLGYGRQGGAPDICTHELTGMKLNHQELRNAAYYGAFKQVNYNLAYENLFRWRKWRVFSEANIARMDEVEETAELMIMMLKGIQGKSPKVSIICMHKKRRALMRPMRLFAVSGR